jgi:ribosome biogenesis GTPase
MSNESDGPRLRSATPVFVVADVVRSAEHYRNRLGFRFHRFWGDQRGMHTTSARELIPLPCGALVVDTPGMRELQLWDGSEGFGAAFADIERLAQNCRFADCRHHGEPGCAVAAAVESGELDSARLHSYHKLERELEFQSTKHDRAVRSAAEKSIRKAHKALKKLYRERGGK